MRVSHIDAPDLEQTGRTMVVQRQDVNIDPTFGTAQAGADLNYVFRTFERAAKREAVARLIAANIAKLPDLWLSGSAGPLLIARRAPLGSVSELI